RTLSSALCLPHFVFRTLSSAHCLPHIVFRTLSNIGGIRQSDRQSERRSAENRCPWKLRRMLRPGTGALQNPCSPRAARLASQNRVLPTVCLSDKYLVRVASPIFELAASLPR